MGCACLKSDVVVKNQKISNQNSEKTKREQIRTVQNNQINSNKNSNSSRNVVSQHGNSPNPNNNNIINNYNSIENPYMNRHSSNLGSDIRNFAGQQSFNNNSNLPNRMPINNITGAMPYLPSNNDPEFNFPELEEVMVGKGLKRMKGYVSSISQSDLEKKRAGYWGTRVEGNQETWEFLRNICENKDIAECDIKEFLNAAGVTTINNCINLTYDSRGYYYEIPNYCINNPFTYEITHTSGKRKPLEKNVEIIIRKVIDEVKYTILNSSLVAELKLEVASTFFLKEGITVHPLQIRFFFSGKELLDNEELWVYNLDDGSIVQMMVKPLD